MNKVFIFYFLACLMMFVCLTAIFAITGIGQYFLSEKNVVVVDKSPATDPIDSVPFTLDEFRKNSASRGFNFDIPLPKLLLGYAYTVSEPVEIYDTLDFETAYSETLPYQGVFFLDHLNMQLDSWVYTVVVNNGRQNYTMYLKEEDLPNTEFYGQPPPEKKLAQHLESLERIERKKETEKRELQTAYEAAIASYNTAEAKRHPKNPLVENLKRVQAHLSNIDSGGVILSGVAAAVLTLGVAFILGSFTWLRNSRAWESDVTFDDIGGAGRGTDYDDEDDSTNEQDESKN